MRYDNTLIARGLHVYVGINSHPEMIPDLLAGRATARQILDLLQADDGRVGVWWGIMGQFGDLADFEDYAWSDDALVDTYEDLDGGEVSIVLVAKRPTRDGEPWDPEIHNPDLVLMGNSFLEDREQIDLVEIRYNAGNGWKSLPVNGLRAIAAAEILDEATKQRLMNDPNTKRLYAVEQQLKARLFHFPQQSISSLQALADRIGNPKMMVMEVGQPGVAGTGLFGGKPAFIGLGPDMRDEVTVIHEMTHAQRAHKGTSSTGSPDHGPDFLKDYLRLLRKYCSNPEYPKMLSGNMGGRYAGLNGDLPEGIEFREVDSDHPMRRKLRAYLGDEAIGSIRWWTDEGEVHGITVLEPYQRRGIATELLRRARELEPKVHHSQMLTQDGEAWVQRVGGLKGGLPEGLVFKDGKLGPDGPDYNPSRWINVKHDGRLIAEMSWEPPFGMTIDGGQHPARVTKIEVSPRYRRRGIATEMMRRAMEITPGLKHSEQLTGDGRAWRNAVSPDQAGDPAYPMRMLPRLSQTTALPSWRDRGVLPSVECVIAPDLGRGRRNSYMVYLYDEPHARRPTLEEAKGTVEDIYGPLDWQRIEGDADPHPDHVWGWTTMFNDAPYYLVIERLPRLGATATMTDPKVKAAVDEFLARPHVPGLTPWDAHDQCFYESDRFIEVLSRHGVRSEKVMGYKREEFMGQQVITQGHVGVKVGTSVYDWTARQFDEHAPVPKIVSIADWTREWPDLTARTSSQVDSEHGPDPDSRPREVLAGHHRGDDVGRDRAGRDHHDRGDRGLVARQGPRPGGVRPPLRVEAARLQVTLAGPLALAFADYAPQRQQKILGAMKAFRDGKVRPAPKERELAGCHTIPVGALDPGQTPDRLVVIEIERGRWVACYAVVNHNYGPAEQHVPAWLRSKNADKVFGRTSGRTAMNFRYYAIDWAWQDRLDSQAGGKGQHDLTKKRTVPLLERLGKQVLADHGHADTDVEIVRQAIGESEAQYNPDLDSAFLFLDDEMRTKWTVLHEMAHVLDLIEQPGLWEDHGDVFKRRFTGLLARYGNVTVDLNERPVVAPRHKAPSNLKVRVSARTPRLWHVTPQRDFEPRGDFKPGGGNGEVGVFGEGLFLTPNPELWAYLWGVQEYGGIRNLYSAEVDVSALGARECYPVGMPERDQYFVPGKAVAEVVVRRTIPIAQAITEGRRSGYGFAMLAFDVVDRSRLCIVDHTMGWGATEALCGRYTDGNPIKWTTTADAKHGALTSRICDECLPQIG